MSFRHTTKQSARSQEWLRARADKALTKDRQLLCTSVYLNTYGINLPSPSVQILDYIISPLTGNASRTDSDRRPLFTVCIGEYQNATRFRLCFLQPEVASATAQTKSAYIHILNSSRSELMSELHNPSPGGIQKSSEKCQVTGRLAPYVIERSGLGSETQWTYCNACKSRFVYIVTTTKAQYVMAPTVRTIQMYQSFAVDDCAIVYMNSMSCFKVTASPSRYDQGDTANKSTCMFLYCDGSFKITGTPHKAYKVCELLRETIIRAHTSGMHTRLMGSLTRISDAPGDTDSTPNRVSGVR